MLRSPVMARMAALAMALLVLEASGAPRAAAQSTQASRYPRTFIIVFDEERLSPAALRRAQAVAVNLFTRVFQPGDAGGVVVNGELAGSRLQSDRIVLTDAVRRARAKPSALSRAGDLLQWPSLSEAEALRVVDDRLAASTVLRRACQEEPRECATPVAETSVDTRIRQKATEASVAVRAGRDRFLGSLASLLRDLSRVDGPETVLMLSEDFAGGATAGRVQETVSAALQANARLYTLAESQIDRDVADALAQGTGGFVARGTRNVDNAVARMAREADLAAAAASTAAASTAASTVASSTLAVVPAAEVPAPPPADAHVPDEAPPVTEPTLATKPPLAGGIVVPNAASTDSTLRLRPLTESEAVGLAGGEWSDASVKAGWEAYQRGELEAARAALAPAAA